MEQQVHVVVSGRVQGVGYRMSAQNEAIGLGLKGWIRNLPHGAVEVVAEGEADALERFITWCRQGPPLARVTDLSMDRGDASGDFQGFEFRF